MTEKKYASEYYAKNRKHILQRAKELYLNTRKKRPKCKQCREILPEGVDPHTKYCDKCLYGKGHGADAHRMAAARWWRKNKKSRKKHLTK